MAERELTLAERRLLAYVGLPGDVLADLTATLDGPSYVPGDALATAYREGRRSVLLDIRACIEAGEELAHNLSTNKTPAAKVEVETGDIWQTEAHLE